MTRRHFEELARAVAELAEEGHLDPKAHRALAFKLSSVCGSFNARFDFGRFMAACGVHTW